MYFLLLLTGILISEVKCGYYFVTAPNVIRFDHEETVVVGVFGLTKAEVKVWLQHGENKFSEKHVTVPNEYTPIHTAVKATENDLFNTYTDEGKPRTIKLCAEWNGQTRSIEIVVSYRTGYLIVQTDKPIYTPLQKVRIRTIALDESLRAVDGWQVGMDIVSPSGITVARRTIAKSDSGFFLSQFTLPPYPETGIWKARAFYTGQFETESQAFFEVKEYVLPTFGVTVDVDVPYILSDTADILVTVRAKYVYGKPVDGKARLTLNLKNQTGLSEYILDVNQKSLENNHGEEGSVTEFNIRVADIRNSPLLRDRDFPPDGSRLEIVATVYESATGKEENTSHGETVFAIKPYIFKFTRSKLNFRPGMEYYLKVDMLYANGQPAAKQTIKVKMFKNGQFDSSEYATVTTDGKGQVVTIFAISQYADTITFVASTSDESYESERFEVKAHVGKNHIQVEQIIKNDEMVMRAYTNMQGTGYTGMLLMVVARGKIVYTKFKEGTNQASEKIAEELQEKVSANARILVFYIDKLTHELVADSVKFDVDKKCRGEGLKLTTEAKVKPGSYHKFTVTGSPFMWVGFSVMDKALFLLNDNNVLKKDKMFDFLEAHDLGCGEGSGRSGADVFQKSGLTILTNAVVDENDLVRNSDRCEEKKRKKRDTGEKSHVVKRSLYEGSGYASDLGLLTDDGIRPRLRSDFRESWLFVTQLDINGQMRQTFYFPYSITEWMIQAVGITPDKGLCIADTMDVKAFASFFIQLDIPYQAVRLEKFVVKATVFNYASFHKTVNIYFEGAIHLCSNSIPGLPSSRVQVNLAPNSSETVNFPMIPLRHGKFPIKVTAIVTNVGIPESDVVEKNLFVVNEGVEEQITINVCLDLQNQGDDCRNDDRVISDYRTSIERVYQVDLTLPETSIPGAATAYIQSTGMDNVVNTVIEGVDSLFEKPSGSGEQKMFRLAPIVYAMRYLKETNQMTSELEIKGNQWIREGVNAEISGYRHDDGSYAAWRSRQSSTWLTAFVAKVFCQARKVVDDAVDEQEDIKITINWLQNHVEYDGSFVDNKPVSDRGMMPSV